MSREWKPGDVAKRIDGFGFGSMLSICVVDCHLKNHDSGRHWHHSDGGWDRLSGGLSTYHPMIFIDPEDVDAIEPLIAPFKAAWEAADARGESGDRVRQALRAALSSLLGDPKPGQPQGLGAVIEDDERTVYVRVSSDASRPWRAVGHGARYDYDDIAVVKVLSEGVTP